MLTLLIFMRLSDIRLRARFSIRHGCHAGVTLLRYKIRALLRDATPLLRFIADALMLPTMPRYDVDAFFSRCRRCDAATIF